MIGKIITHNACEALINYHEKKVKKDKAEKLFSNTLSDDIEEIKKELNDIVKENPNVRKNKFLHIAVSFHKSDNLEKNKESIIRDYIEELGYLNTSYIVYEHHDTKNPHFHIIVPTVDYTGTKIKERKNYIENKRICRKLENKWGLYQIEDKGKGKDVFLDEINANRYLLYKSLKQALKDKAIQEVPEEKINEIYTHLKKEYLDNNQTQKLIYEQFKNPDNVFLILESYIRKNKLHKEQLKGVLNDLIDEVKDKGIEEKIQYFNKKGVYARVIYDEKGELGLVYGLKESSFYIRDYKLGKKFIYSNLDNTSKKLHKFDKRKQKAFLKRVLKNNMVKSNNIDDFETLCRKKGIEIIYNKAGTGRISGISFKSINVEEPVIFKGSELGFSYKYITDYFEVKTDYANRKTIQKETQGNTYEIKEEPVNLQGPFLTGTTKQRDYGEDEFDRMRKGKKKRKNKGL